VPAPVDKTNISASSRAQLPVTFNDVDISNPLDTFSELLTSLREACVV